MWKKVLVLFLLVCTIHSRRCFAAEAVPIVRSSAFESGHVLSTSSSKSLYWITVTWKTTAQRWLIIYDSTTIPGDGPLDVTKVRYCAVVSNGVLDPSIGTKSWDWTNHPLYRGSVGIVAFISTDAAGCTAKTADGNNNWIVAGVN